ncbi:hypothetical protein [Methylobacterium soli]|uniref:hypothetical protein n=1 Tax=Methylobacterium soli TaxID=553447 RepID=UPI001781D663|nr:hypothetical protein [Methylobacterium soli]GJE46223.1 hypothetical protein AEGHOMDF_5423 [Methylobacterium soli]
MGFIKQAQPPCLYATFSRLSLYEGTDTAMQVINRCIDTGIASHEVEHVHQVTTNLAPLRVYVLPLPDEAEGALDNKDPSAEQIGEVRRNHRCH